MSKKDDILAGSKDFKKMPYSVPEGYFESFGARLGARIRQEEGLRREPVKRRIFPARLIPYFSVAAAVAIIVALGVTFGSLGRKTAVPEGGLQDSDYVFYYTEIVPVTEPEAIYYSYNSDSDFTDYDIASSDGLDYDDIINYLFESGVDVNTLIHDLN